MDCLKLKFQLQFKLETPENRLETVAYSEQWTNFAYNTIKTCHKMNRVKGIPYGISDFNRMRNENFYFVDKTMYLPLIEKMPSYLFLIRPRRFGKSLFLSMMRT